jgi:uncharacterized membrane protein YoaT (DUF817 family)
VFPDRLWHQGGPHLPFRGTVLRRRTLRSARRLLGNPRLDVLLAIALLIQVRTVCTKLESVDELKAISIFHLIGFLHEASRHPAASKPGHIRIFLHEVMSRAAIFRLHVRGGRGLYAPTTAAFRPLDRDRKMPLLPAFVLIGRFIWLAENISTSVGIWNDPGQLGT